MNQDELLGSLQKSSILHEELASKSNDELADLVLEKIWADMELFTYNSELLDVVIERLRSGLTKRAPDRSRLRQILKASNNFVVLRSRSCG